MIVEYQSWSQYQKERFYSNTGSEAASHVWTSAYPKRGILSMLFPHRLYRHAKGEVRSRRMLNRNWLRSWLYRLRGLSTNLCSFRCIALTYSGMLRIQSSASHGNTSPADTVHRVPRPDGRQVRYTPHGSSAVSCRDTTSVYSDVKILMCRGRRNTARKRCLSGSIIKPFGISIEVLTSLREQRSAHIKAHGS
jgi:hypothetical protein